MHAGGTATRGYARRPWRDGRRRGRPGVARPDGALRAARARAPAAAGPAPLSRRAALGRPAPAARRFRQRPPPRCTALPVRIARSVPRGGLLLARSLADRPPPDFALGDELVRTFTEGRLARRTAPCARARPGAFLSLRAQQEPRCHAVSTLALFAALSLALHGRSGRGRHQPTIDQESGNPINDQGSSYHYRTYITSITPKVPGLSVEVLEFADRLLLRNHTGKTVTVYGYSGEPYARLLPDGVGRTERPLPGGLPQHELLRERDGPDVGERHRRAAVGSRRPDRSVRMARPPHPLDEPRDAARGQGQEQAHEDLRLDRADQGRSAAGRDQRGTVLGARRARRRRRAIVALVAIVAALLLGALLVETPTQRRRAARRAGGRIARAARAARGLVRATESRLRPSRRRLLGVTLLSACLLGLFGAPAAVGHAQLLGTSPAAGATVPVAARGGDLQVQPERRRHPRRGPRLRRAGRRGGQPRRLPSRRQRSAGWGSG